MYITSALLLLHYKLQATNILSLCMVLTQYLTIILSQLNWDECSFAVPNGTLNLCNGVVNLSANIICNCILITTDCMTLSHHLSLSNCWNHKSAPLQLYTSQSNQPKPRFLNLPHSHVLAGLAYHVDQSKYVMLCWSPALLLAYSSKVLHEGDRLPGTGSGYSDAEVWVYSELYDRHMGVKTLNIPWIALNSP